MRTALIAILILVIGMSASAQDVSPRVRLSQLGLQSGEPATAVLLESSARPIAWRVVDSADRVVARGWSRPYGEDEASGQKLHRLSLPPLPVGVGYRLLAGSSVSRPFSVSTRPYEDLKRDALAYFYHNRSGLAIEADLAGDAALARPAGHVPDQATCFSGQDVAGNVWPGCDYRLDVTGGWYDAGDHGKYVVNGGISLWTLVNVHERAARLDETDPFPDGSQAVPEAGNGWSDLLDEARWELEFMLAMQAPEGARLRLPVGIPEARGALDFEPVDVSGMAHHKIHDVAWTALPTAPHEDRQERRLYPPSTAATLNLAAVGAQCARVWRGVDDALAERCLDAARWAFEAAVRNPRIYAVGSFHGGGDYGDESLADEFHWAAAELYATTGDAAYRERLDESSGGDIGWASVGALGDLTLALGVGVVDPGVQSAARDRLIAMADGYLKERRRAGYAIPYASLSYPWGSNGDLLNRAMVLAVAHDISGKLDYRHAVFDVMDYILGRNALDQSYVSGYGARPLRNPHHRFWAASIDPAYPSPPPGVLSGGPNNSAMSDPVARSMEGECAPQACWRDDIQAFALNEVTINWNAPLVWVLAWLDRPSTAPASAA